MLYGSLNPLLLLLLLPYTLRCFEVIPRPELGAEVLGVNLNTVTKETILELEKAVIEHKWILFRGQNVSRERHVELTTWLGPLDNSARHCNEDYYKSRKSLQPQHEDVMSMSNDRLVGLPNLVLSELHCDTAWNPLPIHYGLWHMETMSRGGNTMFVDLVRTLNEAPEEMVERWEQMSFNLKSGEWTHPFIITHPRSGKKTMLFNFDVIRDVVFNNNTKHRYKATDKESKRILYEILQQLQTDGKLYEHEWQEGDFVISDNLSSGHRGTEASVLPRSEVGLRLLHRASTCAPYPPTKNYTMPTSPSKHAYYRDPKLPTGKLSRTMPQIKQPPKPKANVADKDVPGKGGDGVPGKGAVPDTRSKESLKETKEECTGTECNKRKTKHKQGNDEL